jgi:hypothetical protein
VANSFYFHIKFLKLGQKIFKYWSVVSSHAKDIGIFVTLNSTISQDSNEELSVSSSDDDIVDISDDYEVDPFLKVINNYKSVCHNCNVLKYLFNN